MANVDLNTAIKNLVATEVAKTLEPYRLMLERLAAFIEGSPAPRGPGRPPKAAGGKRGRKARKNGKNAASKFEAGMAVRYRQGRGEFDAKVASVDVEKNQVALVRAKDGKKVNRPASKIYPA